MLNRRGFIGALSGMPIAAVAQPRVSVPEVSTPAAPELHQDPQPIINITINRPLIASDRDALANRIGDALELARRGHL